MSLSMVSKKVWERALKSELGPALTWLLDEMADASFRSKSSDFFLLDPPTTERLTSKAQQTKLGLFVLGRTSKGLFGVDREGDTPLDSRPVFTAPFHGTERTHAAANLGEFLRSLEGFDSFVAQHASKPMPEASVAADTAPPKPEVKAKTKAAKTIKLTKAKAVALAKEQMLVALQALGSAVTLLVYDDEVTSPKANTLDVTLAVNLPASLADALAEHTFVRSVAAAVQTHVAKTTGYRVTMHIVFEPLDTGAKDHVKHLLALVKKTGHAEAEAFVKEASRA